MKLLLYAVSFIHISALCDQDESIVLRYFHKRLFTLKFVLS